MWFMPRNIWNFFKTNLTQHHDAIIEETLKEDKCTLKVGFVLIYILMLNLYPSVIGRSLN